MLGDDDQMSRQRVIHIIEKSEYVTIGELVRLTSMRYSTLKYYTEEGLLPFKQEEEKLTRRYKREESIERLKQILKLKSEGMTIPEVKDALHLEKSQVQEGKTVG